MRTDIPYRILVVEDESIISRDITLSLKAMGYEVADVLTTAEGALSSIEADRPDLVLMDIVLQGEMDGIDAAEQVRSRFNLPVIYLTAYADEKVMQRAKITEPFGYLLKPFDDTELHFTIQMSLYRHRMEERLRLSREQFRLIVEKANIIPMEMDLDTGRIAYVGPQAEKILGYTPDRWTGLGFMLSLIHEEDRECMALACKAGEPHGGPDAPAGFDMEYRMTASDGRTVWLRNLATVLPSESGTGTTLRCVMIDITDKKQAEAEREKLIAELKDALGKIKVLRGLLPICAWCKKIRDDKGYWSQVETYIQEHSDAEFTHSMCPECRNSLEKELDTFKKEEDS